MNKVFNEISFPMVVLVSDEILSTLAAAKRLCSGWHLSPAANCTLQPAITMPILFPQIMPWQPSPMV
ncbi:MAG: hypothetical protein JJ897_05140 [Marinibacterium sp.]|nr:hypothetical protein [Marinibacterium sp.]